MEEGGAEGNFWGKGNGASDEDEEMRVSKGERGSKGFEKMGMCTICDME